MGGTHGPLYYRLNADGTTTPVAEWPNQGIDERRVARDDVTHGIEVSTVFLTLDHRHGDGPPILFETMIFGGEYDNWCYRYRTIDQARAGHARVVAALRAGRDPSDDESEDG
jgi:hypothetical protein